MPRPRRLTNVTLQVDEDDLTWARVRAMLAGTSVNRLIRNFIAEYGAVPDRFRQGLGPPFSASGMADETFAEVLDPRGAGHRAREEPRKS